jgi:hypothetical protein
LREIALCRETGFAAKLQHAAQAAGAVTDGEFTEVPLLRSNVLDLF